MKFITVLLMCLMGFLSNAHADVYLTTTHETGIFLNNQDLLNKTSVPNGKYLYLGSVGLVYEINKSWAVFGKISHRSNLDIYYDEYSYNSINLGIEYKICLTCK